MTDLPFRSAKQLAADLRKKKIGCLELLEAYVARVEKHNPRLNAIIATDLAGARRRARAADAALRKGRAWGPLHGVPMTIKESYDVAGMPTTWGLPFLHDQQGERYERTIRVNGRDVPTTDQLFWAGYTGMVYLPSTVAPIGFTPARLPVGVQIVGPQYADRACIDFARLLEREYQGFVAPAGYE